MIVCRLAATAFRGLVAMIAATTLASMTHAQSQGQLTSTEASNANGDFHFARPALDSLNRMYAVNMLTGHMRVCVYHQPKNETSDGETKCFDEEGGDREEQETAPFRLMTAGHKNAEGVFRINIANGDMIYCFLAKKDDGRKIVCPE